MSEPTLKEIAQRIADKWTAIDGINKVFIEWPGAIPTAQLPAVIVSPADETYSQVSNDSEYVAFPIEMMLFWRESGAHVSDIPVGDMWDALDEIAATFRDDPLLRGNPDGEALVEGARLTSASRFQIIEYANQRFIGRRYILTIWRLRRSNPY